MKKSFKKLPNYCEQKIPDKEKIETVYHPDRDYPVAYRDGNLRNNNQWMVTAYDDYGRPIQTGLVNAASIPDPTNLTPTEVWTKTFYDGAVGTNFTGFRNNFDDVPEEYKASIPPEARAPQPPDQSDTPIYTGKIHYTETAILDGNSISPSKGRLFSINQYDDFGRVKRKQVDNHRGGYDDSYLSYDHLDNLKLENRYHYLENNFDFIINNAWHFDHQGRFIKRYFNSSDGDNSNDINNQQICNITYTPKDQVALKQLGATSNGFLQDINYYYLPNRFLAGINADPTSGMMRNRTTNSDLFHLHLYYDEANPSTFVKGQKNGNISQLTWWSTNENAKGTYGYNYDYLDRLISAQYGTINNTYQITPSGEYFTSYGYDARGNIRLLNRAGMVQEGANFVPQTIDELSFPEKTNSNQIATIKDASVSTTTGIPAILPISGPIASDTYVASQQIYSNGQVASNSDVVFQAGDWIVLEPGFEADDEFLAYIQPPSNDAGFAQKSLNPYEYDANGNMNKDPNKGITTSYNYLNLPYNVTYDNGDQIAWLYDASGRKWKKTVSGSQNTQQEYIDAVEYKGGVLEAIYLEDARVVFDSGVFRDWEYYLRDHLGNNRVVFKDNGSGQAEMVQESHFYPFGMEMEGDWTQSNTADPENNYLYNGKELDQDFGLDWYHYGFRMYDPQIGRFTGVDPISDQFAWVSTVKAP